MNCPKGCKCVECQFLEKHDQAMMRIGWMILGIILVITLVQVYVESLIRQ